MDYLDPHPPTLRGLIITIVVAAVIVVLCYFFWRWIGTL
jgi:uncharacterized membrane protein YwaF